MTTYERLKKDLCDGKITLVQIDIAVMDWILQRKDIPEGVKNLLVVPAGGGLVRNLFQQMKQVIGSMELAYRRGEQKEQNETLELTGT